MIHVELNAEVQCVSRKCKILDAKFMDLKMSLMDCFLILKHLSPGRLPLDGPTYLSQHNGERKLCLYVNSLGIDQANGNHTVDQ